MEHHEAVYEQIIEVSNATQGADFLSHHLVQEIVVPNDSNAPSNMNCEISGMDIILPNDCIAIQDQCNSNIMISCGEDGIEQDKQTGHLILQESTKVEHISHANDIASSTEYAESHKEVKVQEFVHLHDQTTYSQEAYQVTNLVTVTSANDNRTGAAAAAAAAAAESIVHTTASIPPNKTTTLAPTSHTSLDSYDLISSSQNVTINTGQEKKSVHADHEKVINQAQSTEEALQVDSALVVEGELSNGILVPMTIEESQIDSQIHSTNEESQKDTLKAVLPPPVPEGDSISSLAPEPHFENSSDVGATGNSEIVTETQILTNSDDIAVMAEFNSIEYSTKEEIGVVQPAETERSTSEQLAEELRVQTEDVAEESVKDEPLQESSMEIAVEMGEEIIQSKLERPSSNEVSFNQSIQEEDEIDLHLSTQSTDSHRKVIQDIFDDWQDENCEEENNQSVERAAKDHQDSVEKELQNLLNDDAQQVQTVSSTNAPEAVVSSTEITEQQQHKQTDKGKSGKLDKSKGSSSSSSSDSSPVKPKSSSSSSRSSARGRDKSQHAHKSSSKSVMQEDSKKVHPRPGVKVPGSHLTSPIASTAEVAEALSKRLREKQKDLVVPKTADVVFVKKISQRLSNQLAQVVASMPHAAAAVPLQQTPAAAAAAASNDVDKDKSIEDVPTGTSKASSVSDNNELLAILEGDADPEWSNLKPETSKTSNSNSASSSSGKLDPAMERELALKQLLELPNITPKKNAAASSATQKKPKKAKEPDSTATATTQQTRSKLVKEELLQLNPTKDDQVINLDSAEEDSPRKAKKVHTENSQNETEAVKIEIGIDESRSGRKRKLTEKAREHELAVKRQKVFKNKTAESKRLPQDAAESTKQKPDATTETTKSEKAGADSESTNEDKLSKIEAKQVLKTDSKTEAKAIKGKVLAVKNSKLGLLKKNASISKKKLAVKNLLKQKAASKNAAKSKAPPTMVPKKTDIPSVEKSTSEKAVMPTGPAHKGKKVSEIDRLLQDEGVVNLLYDVEQPDSRKRLVPITKSQKKVMDVEKAERELKLRTKMVKNAVLRLRNSASATVKISPRSRRSAVSDQSSPQAENRAKSQKSQSSTPSESTDFVIPAKIRNAADASRIIRRHSSSSFSSASASPRVSIDVPPESLKLDELEALAKSKRKFSRDSAEKLDAKKSKKKVAGKSESEGKDESEKSPSKKATRSNAVNSSSSSSSSSPKAVAKSGKKVPKSRSSSDALWNDVSRGASRDQDELSACLAEAASALESSISASSRSSGTPANRKKGGASKGQSDDEKLDCKKFSNKEINVRKHGHLVQLILTPSAPVSGIRNAISIPVMREIREALAILRSDDDCRVVLFTSTGTSFCEGLELSYLQQSNKDERKARAEEMANAVRDFVRALAAFNKPIVAGVQGAATGLGVTMLPLFDLVIASDKATFSTPYGKLGQIAEGAAVLTLSHSLGSAVTNELLLGGRTLTASEALRAGLVTRVLWPDRFQGELLPSLKVMSEQSAQAMEATKVLLRRSLRRKLDAALESESLLLVQHWCSQECQEAIKAYVEEKGQ